MLNWTRSNRHLHESSVLIFFFCNFIGSSVFFGKLWRNNVNNWYILIYNRNKDIEWSDAKNFTFSLDSLFILLLLKEVELNWVSERAVGLNLEHKETFFRVRNCENQMHGNYRKILKSENDISPILCELARWNRIFVASENLFFSSRFIERFFLSFSLNIIDFD